MATIFTVYWVSADKQDEYDMGSYRTHGQALANVPACKRELLAECQTHAEIAAVIAGSWAVIPEDC